MPGDSAQVSVPACGVPLAGGTEPNAPDVLATDPLELALEQAASPAAAVTAHTASAMTRPGRRTGFPRDLAVPVPGSGFRVWAMCGRVIAAAFPRWTNVVPRARSWRTPC